MSSPVDPGGLLGRDRSATSVSASVGQSNPPMRLADDVNISAAAVSDNAPANDEDAAASAVDDVGLLPAGVTKSDC